MQSLHIPIWKTSPFCRLLLPLIAGIIIQWYLQFPVFAIVIPGCCFSIGFLLFYFLPLVLKYRFKSVQGLLLLLVLMSFAMFITWNKDIRHHPGWYGQTCH